MKSPALQRQRGMTLFVALVMLVLITLLAMSTFNLGKSSIQVVNNMQNRDEGIAASRRVLDEAMSSTRFFDTPQDALAAPCGGTSNTRCSDVNGDGLNDIVTTLSRPACVKVKGIKNMDLNLNDAEDRGCSVGVQQGTFGQANSGGTSGNSMCSDTTWEMTASSEDKQAQSKVDVVQGVAVRIAASNADTFCN
jgi:Tfp pilus assembly protein PilX